MQVVQATLFNNNRVNINKECLQIGGSFLGRTGDPIIAYDSRLVDFFYTEANKASNPVVFDIGASTGSFSLFETINPLITTYSFEPNIQVYNYLKQNIGLNNLKRAMAFNLAISNKDDDTVTLKIPSSSWESGLANIGTPLRFKSWREQKVNTITLDTFVKRNNIEKIDIIKLDTEGCELLILQGAKNILSRFHPKILTEISNTGQFGYDYERIMELLTQFKYNYNRVGEEDLYAY